jgi:hypothetical protein
MKLALPIKSFFTPSTISMAAVTASFAAWEFPTFGVLLKGFNHKESLDLTSTVMLVCWYAMIFACFYVGQKLGSARGGQKGRIQDPVLSLDANGIYYSFTLISTVGIVSTLSQIFANLSLQEAVLSISLGQANALKESLYEQYHIGLVSLRYLILYPASLALYRIIRQKRYSVLNFFNVLMLGISTFLSSRLILMATLLVTCFLLTYGRKRISISLAKAALWAGVIFLILSVLNISRNAGYYDRNRLSFGLAGASEIVTYVGSPFQVAVGASKVSDQLAGFGGDQYRDWVDIDYNLNTNSAFALLLQQMGYWSWPYIATVCLLMGLVFGAMVARGRTIFLLPCGAILYGSAELWRLDLFQQGAFIIWFVFGIGLPGGLFLIRLLTGILKKTAHPLSELSS